LAAVALIRTFTGAVSGAVSTVASSNLPHAEIQPSREATDAMLRLLRHAVKTEHICYHLRQWR
jgi:hypothetical protein